MTLFPSGGYIKNEAKSIWNFNEFDTNSIIATNGTVTLQDELAIGGLQSPIPTGKMLRFVKDLGAEMVVEFQSNFTQKFKNTGKTFISFYTYQTSVPSTIEAELRVFANTVLVEALEFKITQDSSGLYLRHGQNIDTEIYTGQDFDFEIVIKQNAASTFWFGGFSIQNLGATGYDTLPVYTPPRWSERQVATYFYCNSLSAVNLTSNTYAILTNNGLAAGSTKIPYFNIADLFKTSTNRFSLAGLSIGDAIDIRIQLNVTTNSANEVVNGILTFAMGADSEFTVPFMNETLFKDAGTRTLSFNTRIFVRSSDMLTNAGKIEIRTTGSGSAQIIELMVQATKNTLIC